MHRPSSDRMCKSKPNRDRQEALPERRTSGIALYSLPAGRGSVFISHTRRGPVRTPFRGFRKSSADSIGCGMLLLHARELIRGSPEKQQDHRCGDAGDERRRVIGSKQRRNGERQRGEECHADERGPPCTHRWASRPLSAPLPAHVAGSLSVLHDAVATRTPGHAQLERESHGQSIAHAYHFSANLLGQRLGHLP